MPKPSKEDSLIEAIKETEDMKTWSDLPSQDDNPRFQANPYLRKMVSIPTSDDFQVLSETTRQMLFDWYKDNLKVTLMKLKEAKG